MRVYAFPADSAGCGQYRIRWPAETLARTGHDVTILDEIRYGPRSTMLDGVDVAVVQRPCTQRHVDFIAHCIDRGVTVVAEIDDDLRYLWRGHPLSARLSRRSPDPTAMTIDAFELACKMADWLTCTTPALAELGRPGRTTVIPNMIPELRVQMGVTYRKPLRYGTSVIGYSGPPNYHLPDIGPIVGRGVVQAQQATGALFYGIGGRAFDLGAAFRVTERAQFEDWKDNLDYGPAGFVAAQAKWDVALAPLCGCKFNDAKSDLKLLEAMALGIPFVASPATPAYRAILDAGYGRPARTPTQWREAILAELDDPSIRVDYIDYARTRTFEGNRHLWWNAWTEARDSR